MDSALERRVRDLKRRLTEADGHRLAGRWSEAHAGYLSLLPVLPELPPLHHHLALCSLALGDSGKALEFARRAAELDPSLWQSRLVQVKALRKLGLSEEALGLLDRLMEEQPNEAVRAERASLMLHEFGDAVGAAESAGTADRSSGEGYLHTLVSLLYDPGTQSALEVNEQFRRYSEAVLEQGMTQMASSGSGNRRIRLGLISPQFFASPVYFFSYGALRNMSSEADLVFFHRGSREDWATNAFKSLATEWHDVARLEPEELAALLHSNNLDALLDLGGWMDPNGLRALATKPAARQFKWVGGQSHTTGLHCFDGFIGDEHQSPRSLQGLYSEPLVLMEQGYVTYTPPGYMPAAGPADPGGVIGVISNPLKLSRKFLAELSGLLRDDCIRGSVTQLRMIDHRYRHAALRTRITDALGGEESGIRIDFVFPANHLAYLTEISRLAVVLDTFPYSGGLTTMEALWMGVPSLTRNGQLFCERHTYAHCCYAGLEEWEFLLNDPGSLVDVLGRMPSTRKCLVPEGSPRTNHAQLARSMLKMISA